MAEKKKVFISFEFDEDKHYRNLLTAWDKNTEFDFKFQDASISVAVNSKDADYVKSVIKGKIENSTHLLCIVGKTTATSAWVAWEIATAKALNKKLIGVKIDSGYITPTPLLNAGATWAMSFTFDAIKKAVG